MAIPISLQHYISGVHLSLHNKGPCTYCKEKQVATTGAMLALALAPHWQRHSYRWAPSSLHACSLSVYRISLARRCQMVYPLLWMTANSSNLQIRLRTGSCTGTGTGSDTQDLLPTLHNLAEEGDATALKFALLNGIHGQVDLMDSLVGNSHQIWHKLHHLYMLKSAVVHCSMLRRI